MSTAQLKVEELEGADRIWHLQRTALAEGLDFRDLALLARLCCDRIYPRGERIFEQGNAAQALYILNRGTVRISVHHANGRERTVELLKTGDIFGEGVLAPEQLHQVEATAQEECWVSLLAKEKLRRLLEERPRVAWNLAQILSQKLKQVREELESLTFLNTEQKLARLLVRLARAHGRAVVNQMGMLKLRLALSHEQLARMIGGNRPHVSTIMSEFKKRGLVAYDGRKLLVDVEGLALVETKG